MTILDQCFLIGSVAGAVAGIVGSIIVKITAQGFPTSCACQCEWNEDEEEDYLSEHCGCECGGCDNCTCGPRETDEEDLT